MLELKILKQKFVFVPTGKAGNNISIVCTKFYIEQSLRELGIFEDLPINNNHASTYNIVDHPVDDIINTHITFIKKMFPKIKINIPKHLPSLYWIPKMHKNPTKQRYISASSNCTTKHISEILTKTFKLIENTHRNICRLFYKENGINPMWIIKNSTAVHEKIASFDHLQIARPLRRLIFLRYTLLFL